MPVSGSDSGSLFFALRARSAVSTITATHEANPGEVWEESEFWVALSWKIDPDGSLGIRKFFESPKRPGEPITMDEYYGWMFENSVPGLPEAAAKEQLTPLAYMRKYGVFQVSDKYLQPRVRARARSRGTRGHDSPEDGETILRNGVPAGINVDGVACTGFNTPSRRLEFFSPTMAEWGWPEHALPKLRARARLLARPQARARASSICCRTSGCRRSSTRDRR